MPPAQAAQHTQGCGSSPLEAGDRLRGEWGAQGEELFPESLLTHKAGCLPFLSGAAFPVVLIEPVWEQS